MPENYFSSSIRYPVNARFELIRLLFSCQSDQGIMSIMISSQELVTGILLIIAKLCLFKLSTFEKKNKFDPFFNMQQFDFFSLLFSRVFVLFDVLLLNTNGDRSYQCCYEAEGNLFSF